MLTAECAWSATAVKLPARLGSKRPGSLSHLVTRDDLQTVDCD